MTPGWAYPFGTVIPTCSWDMENFLPILALVPDLCIRVCSLLWHWTVLHLCLPWISVWLCNWAFSTGCIWTTTRYGPLNPSVFLSFVFVFFVFFSFQLIAVQSSGQSWNLVLNMAESCSLKSLNYYLEGGCLGLLWKKNILAKALVVLKCLSIGYHIIAYPK